jgi:hypothetical protein
MDDRDVLIDEMATILCRTPYDREVLDGAMYRLSYTELCRILQLIKDATAPVIG